MKEYEQQIDDLINSGDVNNWRLALELCRGLIDEEAACVFICKKCHAFTFNNIKGNSEYFTEDRFAFIRDECNCTWTNGYDTIEYNEPRRTR